MFSAGHVGTGAVQHGDSRRKSGILSLDGNMKILEVSTASLCDVKNPEHHYQFCDVGFLGQGEDACSYWMHLVFFPPG
jgi:hypothetical protein